MKHDFDSSSRGTEQKQSVNGKILHTSRVKGVYFAGEIATGLVILKRRTLELSPSCICMNFLKPSTEIRTATKSVPLRALVAKCMLNILYQSESECTRATVPREPSLENTLCTTQGLSQNNTIVRCSKNNGCTFQSR